MEKLPTVRSAKITDVEHVFQFVSHLEEHSFDAEDFQRGIKKI